MVLGQGEQEEEEEWRWMLVKRVRWSRLWHTQRPMGDEMERHEQHEKGFFRLGVIFWWITALSDSIKVYYCFPKNYVPFLYITSGVL